MYLLDKAFAWTGLWMVVMSPFAGNILTLASIVKNRSKVSGFQQLVSVVFFYLFFHTTLIFFLNFFLSS